MNIILIFLCRTYREKFKKKCNIFEVFCSFQFFNFFAFPVQKTNKKQLNTKYKRINTFRFVSSLSRWLLVHARVLHQHPDGDPLFPQGTDGMQRAGRKWCCWGRRWHRWIRERQQIQMWPEPNRGTARRVCGGGGKLQF